MEKLLIALLLVGGANTELIPVIYKGEATTIEMSVEDEGSTETTYLLSVTPRSLDFLRGVSEQLPCGNITYLQKPLGSDKWVIACSKKW